MLSQYQCTLSDSNPSSCKKLRINSPCLTPSYNAFHSASVVEVATVCCVRDTQSVIVPPNLMMHPVQDFLVSSFPAKSASLYPLRLYVVSCDFGKYSPYSRLVYIYPKTCCRDLQCRIVGAELTVAIFPCRG